MKIKVLLVSAAFAAVLLAGYAYSSNSGRGAAAAEQVVSILKQPDEVTTHAVHYNFNSTDIASGSDPALDRMVQYLKSNPLVHLEIQSGTNDIENRASNPALSQQRTDAVRAYLIAAGIDASRLDVRD